MNNYNDNLDIEVEDEQSSDVLIEYDIASYPSDYTLSVLYKMWQDNDIEIPDFQRGFVWTMHQSSLLIESFLIGLPVPPIFLYIDKENTNLVVDGQQRLLSVVFFMEGYFGGENEKGKRQTFRLIGLHEKNPYYNKKFTDLSNSDQKKLENSVLRAINIRQLTPSPGITSIYHIFERLNTGGTPLTSQEIRNVVYRGDFFTKLKILNKDENWRKILGKKTLDKHQKDVELILRAFALSNYLDEYEKPMKESLNKISGQHKKGDHKEVEKFMRTFPIVCKLIVGTFTEKPFHVRGPLNTSVFDSVFCTLINNLNKIPDDLGKRYEKLIKDKKFVELTSLGTTDTKIVNERFDYVENKLIR